jgi:hypothetical protein
MKKKVDYMLKGFILTFINLGLTLNGYSVLGVLFGVVAVIYFLKALRINE